MYESRLSHHSMASLSNRSTFSIPHPQPIPSPSVLSLVEKKNPETSEAFLKQWSEDLSIYQFSSLSLGLSYLESTGDGA